MASVRDDPGPRVPLPPLLTVGGVVPLVGRAEPLGDLEATWTAAASGVRRVVLVAGEAGAGKTRLLSEFARSVHERGATVLYGTCSQDQTVPYQPFAEALGHVLSSDGVDVSDIGPAIGELARMVPGITGAVSVERPGSGDPDAERARLFRAVIATIAHLALDAPVLIVLDDLHWARRPTIDLLTRLVSDQALQNVMIVGSYRPTPLDMAEALSSALPDLRRLPGVTRLGLAGLDADGVTDFVAAASGRADAPSPSSGADWDAVADVLVRQTDGNAFLLVELWLHLIDTGIVGRRPDGYVVVRPLSDIDSPDGVREVVAARLARLDEQVRDLLATAAVLGPVFSPVVLAAAVDETVDDVLSRLEVALRALLIDAAAAGTFRFCHELIRRAVYDDLGLAERRRRHRAVAGALAGNLASVGDHARHLLAAVPLVEPSVAVAAARRAAEAAATSVAFDDAADFLDAALEVATQDRAELLLQAAQAMMRAGAAVAAKRRCLEAHELAEHSGDGALQIAAALTYSEAWWRETTGDLAASMLRGALQLAPDDQTQVRIQTALTRTLAIAGEGDAARVLGEDALASARRLDDADLSRAALVALSYAPWTPETLPAQLGYMREAVDTARLSGDVEWEALAIGKLLYGEVIAGELDAARATTERQSWLASRAGQPLFVALDHQAQSLVALAEGRFADAERLAEAADAVTRTLAGAPPGGYGVQLFGIRREQGRLEEARPVVEAVARLDRQRSAWRPALAVMYAELGLVDAAAGELAVLTADRLGAIPRDALWVGALSYLADACRVVGDERAAAAVYDQLVAWRGLVVQVGFLLAAHGAVDRYLGELAVVLRWDREAEIHFEAALRLDTAAAMPVWLAHTQLAFGRFLAGRGRPADSERAADLLNAALAKAEPLGMEAVVAAARAVIDGPAHRAHDPAGLTEREVAVVGLVAEGCSNREIGERLHISPYTAANHVRSILMKTACANRTEAATWALRHGFAGDR